MIPKMTPEEYEALRVREEQSKQAQASPPAVVQFPSTARTMPHSIEAEEKLIGSCLIMEDEGQILQKAIDAGLNGTSFYSAANGIIFDQLRQMVSEKKPIEVSVLYAELQGAGKLEAIGGLDYLTRLSDSVPTTAQGAYFIGKVREYSVLRDIIRTGTLAAEQAYSFTGDVDEFAADFQRRTGNLAIQRASKGTAYTVWTPAAFRAYQPPPNLNILGAGYIRRRQLTTLIGPPGVGKSRLSLWMACCHIANRVLLGLDPVNSPAKWLFFGNENDPLRQKTDLDWFYRNMTVEEQQKIDDNLFMHVLEKPDDGIITLADPEAFAKLCSTLKQVQPDVVVFDPWGNMIEGNENDNEEIRRTLKALFRAIGQNCPEAAILVIHHARTGKSTAMEAGNNFSGGSLGRGSKALVSAARCELALWPGHSEDSTKLVLTCEKVNNVKKFEPKGLIFENGIYTEDTTFSVDAWKDDIEGNRSSKTLTIADIIPIVKLGIHKAGEIVAACEKEHGASKATVTRRLGEAVQMGYLVKTQPLGSYTLGPKAL